MFFCSFEYVANVGGFLLLFNSLIRLVILFSIRGVLRGDSRHHGADNRHHGAGGENLGDDNRGDHRDGSRRGGDVRGSARESLPLLELALPTIFTVFRYFFSRYLAFFWEKLRFVCVWLYLVNGESNFLVHWIRLINWNFHFIWNLIDYY